MLAQVGELLDHGQAGPFDGMSTDAAALSTLAGEGWLALFVDDFRGYGVDGADALDQRADLRDEAEQVIRPALQRIESADPARHLAGLKNIVKGEDRLKEKLADAWDGRPQLTARQVLGMIPDIVRSTFTYSSEGYADGVAADIDREALP